MGLSKGQKIVIILLFVLIYGFLISQVPWQLVFSNTMVAGGDTGSHNYVAYYSQKIFPKIKWWSPDWYAGFPFLYFYPPLLYYFTAFLSHFFPLNIIFKLITLLGTFLLPLMVFLGLYFLDFRFPIPSLGALLSLNYLFLEKFSIYGGNIPSTLAGEFSYSFAFALFFLFSGLLVKGIKKNRYLLPLIFILSLMVLSHPFSVMVALLFALLLLGEEIIRKNGRKAIIFLTKVFGLTFALTTFWSLPFLRFLPYTSKMSWTKAIHLGEIFPPVLLPWQIIALGGIAIAFFYRDKKIIPLLLIIIAALPPFLFLNHSSVWNARFLPFMLMGSLLLATYALGKSYQILDKTLSRRNKKWFLGGAGILLLFAGYVVIRYIPARVNYIPSWEQWNYEGIESKKQFPELKELADYLRSLPFGRVMWEYRKEYDKFGTPRILEDLPIWDNKPTFEGLLIESSLSGYFHFINQAETTKTPTSAIAGLKYPSFNFAHGVKHLQLFGAQYFVAFTNDIKQLANRYLVKLADKGEFSVYRVPNAQLVEAVPQIQLRPFKKGWLDKSIDWYKGMDFSHFLVFYHNKKEEKELQFYASFPPLKRKKIEAINSSIKIVSVKNDSLTLSLPYLNRPYLVKYTYFPGWKVKGAKGPYLISPSFMMIVPYQERVTLQFGYNNWDKIGMILSLITLIFLFAFPKIGKPSHFVVNLKKKHLNSPG